MTQSIPHSDFYLLEEEVDFICRPVTQPAAQMRMLKRMGLYVTPRGNGKPLVIRSHAEAVLSGAAKTSAPSSGTPADEASKPKPNIEAFEKLVKGGKRGASKAVKSTQPA